MRVWVLAIVATGCSFEHGAAPGGTGDSDAGTGSATADAPPDTPFVAKCTTSPDFTMAANGRRYRATGTSSDYDTAIDRCAADDAHVVVIDNATENAIVLQIAGETWIGLDDLTNETKFGWVTRSASTFRRFDTNEPNDNPVEDCVYMKTNGLWNDTSCGEVTRDAVCECDPTYQPPATPACRTMSGSLSFHGRRYFARDAASWDDASAYCASIGAHVATVADADENAFLGDQITGDLWLGLTDKALEGTYVWDDGAPLDYTRWPAGTPGNDDLDCVLMEAASGNWIDAECAVPRQYVCECDPSAP